MSDTAEPNEDVERISARIQALIGEHFDRGEARFYLSGLGSLLGDDRIVLEKASKRKLADFVENVLGYELQRGGQHLNVLHIERPAGLAPPTVKPENKPLKFVPEIWAAFKTPISAGERRFFNPVTRVTGSTADADGAAIEIPSHRLSEAARPAEQVAESIRAWLEEDAGLDLSLFLATRRQRDADGPTLLNRILEALDGDQLRRTHLPLDVVKTLDERRG